MALVRRQSRRDFLKLLTRSGALFALAPLQGLQSAESSPLVRFVDVTRSAGLLHARNVSGRAEDKQLL